MHTATPKSERKSRTATPPWMNGRPRISSRNLNRTPTNPGWPKSCDRESHSPES